DPVGGDRRQPEPLRQGEGRLVARLLGPVEVALKLDVDVATAEEGDELAEQFPPPARGERGGERPALPPGEADEAPGEFGEVRRGRCRLPLLRPQLDARDPPAGGAVAF